MLIADTFGEDSILKVRTAIPPEITTITGIANFFDDDDELAKLFSNNDKQRAKHLWQCCEKACRAIVMARAQAAKQHNDSNETAAATRNEAAAATTATKQQHKYTIKYGQSPLRQTRKPAGAKSTTREMSLKKQVKFILLEITNVGANSKWHGP